MLNPFNQSTFRYFNSQKNLMESIKTILINVQIRLIPNNVFYNLLCNHYQEFINNCITVFSSDPFRQPKVNLRTRKTDPCQRWWPLFLHATHSIRSIKWDKLPCRQRWNEKWRDAKNQYLLFPNCQPGGLLSGGIPNL